MKHYQSVQILFLSSFLSILFSSGNVFAYKESDFYKLKNTKNCTECDLTELNLSRVNLSRVNLRGSDLSGSDLSGSDLSGSDLSGVNLSRVILNGTNLKNINLTGANLNRIIIDIKALSTLDLSESTFLNKSTLAEEGKKEKEQVLRMKKKEKELKNRKEQALKVKKGKELRKKIEKTLKKKKEQATRKQEVDEKSVFVHSDEKCYVAVQSSIDFEPSLLSIISISLISKFLNEVEQVPPGGIPIDSCQYQISVTKNNHTTLVTFRGEGLNSSGDSKLSGLDGFQQSILKSLYRSLKNKRELICQDYATLLEACGKTKIKKRQSGALLGTWEKSMLKNSLA